MTEQENMAAAFMGGRNAHIYTKEIDMDLTDVELSEMIFKDTGKVPQEDSVYLFLTHGNADGQVVILKPKSDGDEMLILECRTVPEMRKHIGSVMGREQLLREVFKEE
ncbi:hypothetical protein [Pedobacter sp. JY14-1]|uniref:hypothetical protein n=1 Tax=Pedobacter sp. JY14-1 TaxID=3034151 RepID=UPI0023E0E2D0|nr:hypothetical protein [Pedobacter sp. JY14-1]